ncbi:hypothetical protein [Dyadobacter psychrophilus]|uniref:Protein SCO1/2 n=1 Tax=Dyadobacter psychrophilus TaxID=651661 RepID=A0A1T5GN11_9BACT|nr:hypothetical protein [Dyadobacter psychrophilus]SKC09748.1 hypothetical protein SAMN05660293_04153 [Dyadobacter psychrophilus]
MKNFPKAGLLIVTLVIPALIFVMLRLFATNHYDLPYFNPQVGSDGKIVIVNGDTVFHKREALQLASGEYKLGNDISVISFLPGACSDTCRLVLSNLERVYDMRSETNSLTIKTLSEDSVLASPAYPEELGKEGWDIFRATNAEAGKLLNLQSASLQEKPELYQVESRLMLIDSKGYTRGFYNGASSEEIDRLMAEVKILNYENKASAYP